MPAGSKDSPVAIGAGRLGARLIGSGNKKIILPIKGFVIIHFSAHSNIYASQSRYMATDNKVQRLWERTADQWATDPADKIMQRNPHVLPHGPTHTRSTNRATTNKERTSIQRGGKQAGKAKDGTKAATDGSSSIKAQLASGDKGTRT